VHLVRFDERLDLFLFLIGKSDARFSEGDDALDRVVESLAECDCVGLCAAEDCCPMSTAAWVARSKLPPISSALLASSLNVSSFA
jgi:hypothetical protein